MIGVVAQNLGGPDSPAAVEPFLRNLFRDADVIQLGWASFLQPLFAKVIARKRAPESRKAYAQIGGRSPILEQSLAQVTAVTQALGRRGVPARPYVAMSCWHPMPAETVAAMRADGITRAVALSLFPQYSHTTTGSSFKALDRAVVGNGIEVVRVERYPDAAGYIDAVCDRVQAAIATLPAPARDQAPVLFSAHGLPESYIRRGDPYLDDIRITFEAVRRRLALGQRAQLSFQSRVGRAKWLAPYTEAALDELADAGHTAVVVCPIAFTGEHIETLQEIDILFRERARARGLVDFARAATVGCHPAFIAALTDLTLAAARARGWA